MCTQSCASQRLSYHRKFAGGTVRTLRVLCLPYSTVKADWLLLGLRPLIRTAFNTERALFFAALSFGVASSFTYCCQRYNDFFQTHAVCADLLFQKLYRFINCVELVSPHHAARELVNTIRQGHFTSLFQKSVKRVIAF